MDIREARIRKLVTGDHVNGMAYQVGGLVVGKQYEIVEIFLDEDYFEKFHLMRYNVMVRSVSTDEVFMWKNIFSTAITSIENLIDYTKTKDESGRVSS